MVASNRFFSAVVGLLLAGLVHGEDSCNASHDILTPAELFKLKGCQDFKGKVTVKQGYAGAVTLPELTSISGELVLESSTVSEIVFEKLTKVNVLSIKDAHLSQLNLKFKEVKKLTIDNLKGEFPINFSGKLEKAETIKISNNFITGLEGLDFEKVHSLEIISNTKLNSISLPNLSEATGSLQFKGNEQAILSAPKLSKVGDNGLLDISAVKSIELPKLKELGSNFLLIHLNGESFEFPELTKAHGIKISNNTNLKSIKFPVLNEITKAGLSVEHNKVLTTVEIPALVAIDGGLYITAPLLSEFKFNEKLGSSGLGKVETTLECSKFDSVIKQFKQLKCEHVKVEKVDTTKDDDDKKEKEKEKEKEKVKEGETGKKTEETTKGGSALSVSIPTFSALTLVLLATFY